MTTNSIICWTVKCCMSVVDVTTSKYFNFLLHMRIRYKHYGGANDETVNLWQRVKIEIKPC